MTTDRRDDDRATPHPGPAHSSPYPMSRLAPSFGLVDLAREIDQADQMLGARLNAQLAVIADQVRALQGQARRILEQARQEQQLHHARCAFRRIPGHTYHLYRDDDGGLRFSMLSPQDWHGAPPSPFVGSFRLENDMSWTPAADAPGGDDSRQLLSRLLGGDPPTRDGD